jgi:AcrR family transcriptional regulator
LRAEIIAATKQLLARTGNADDVSLRAVAELVGVTSPSIYLHFTDKDDLIHAVVADVFSDLDRAMQQRAATEVNPMDRILAAGMAYVAFAVEHPEHYRVALMSPHAHNDDLDQVLADGAFANFNSLVIDCLASGDFAAADPRPISLSLWTAAHGVASLFIAKPGIGWGDAEAFTYRALCSAGLGQALFDRLESGGPSTVSAWLEKLQTEC